MIIWGTKSVRGRAQGGEFYCPNCAKQQPYTRTRFRRYFTLYFIPLIPLNVLGESVQCDFCKREYRPEVLSYDPKENMRLFRKRMEDVLLQVLLLIATADGEPQPAKLSAIQNIFNEISSTPIGEEALRRDLARRPSLQDVMRRLSELESALNDDGKEMFIKAAILVSSADQRISDDEYKIIRQISEVLSLSEAHLRGIVDSLFGSEASSPGRLAQS